MTPIPHVNSDDSDGTETEDEKVIVSMCCQCGERVPIQMKENGSCHGKCYFCKKNEEHLVCSAVNPDIMKDDIPHSWCDRCHNYVPSRTLANGSCHGACRYCVSRVIHDICNPAIPMTRNYISRLTQHYDTVEEAMRVENEIRQGNNLPADEEYTMVRGPDHRMNPNAFIWIRSAPMDKIAEFQGPHREITARRPIYSSQSATSRFMRATDPDIMDEHRVNTSRKRSPPNATITTTTTTLKSDSSGSVQVVDKPKPEVIDLSIEDIEDMFQTDVQEQAAIAASTAKAESDAEDEARRSGKAVKKKKHDDSDKSKSRKDSPGPDKDKGKRFA